MTSIYDIFYDNVEPTAFPNRYGGFNGFNGTNSNVNFSDYQHRDNVMTDEEILQWNREKEARRANPLHRKFENGDILSILKENKY